MGRSVYRTDGASEKGTRMGAQKAKVFTRDLGYVQDP